MCLISSNVFADKRSTDIVIISKAISAGIAVNVYAYIEGSCQQDNKMGFRDGGAKLAYLTENKCAIMAYVTDEMAMQFVGLVKYVVEDQALTDDEVTEMADNIVDYIKICNVQPQDLTLAKNPKLAARHTLFKDLKSFQTFSQHISDIELDSKAILDDVYKQFFMVDGKPRFITLAQHLNGRILVMRS